MADWHVYCFECADVPAREALMERFERDHPVSVPKDRYSVRAAVTADGERRDAEFGWVGTYLYVTTTEEADDLVFGATEGWERAAIGEFDAGTGTAETVTLVLDPAAGADDEVAGGRFYGTEGLGGMDVLYALAMTHQFRFRSYTVTPPVRHRANSPDAFTAVDAVDRFVEDMAEVTGVEPTDAGRAFLASDPGTDDRYVFGETYGPIEGESEAPMAEPLDPERARSGEELPDPGDVLAADERPGGDGGLLARLRRLLGR